MSTEDAYNPFGKKLSEINESDLLVLKEVHEGWYVDYKVEAISSVKYAKAISAMANTYGGWIFIGIEEESRDRNVAGSFLGVPRSEIDLNCQKIRQSVAQNLNPQPFFEICAVKSPEAIEDEHIICIYVPESPKAPIVHSDGRIYRRINDSSEPVAENNREEINNLFQKSDKIEKRYEDWYKKDPELSKGEDGVSYLKIISTPDFWNEENIWYSGSTEEFKKLVEEKSNGVHFSTSYNNYYSKRGGFICRCVSGEDARQISNTLIFNRNLNTEVWIPIPSFDISNYENYNYKSASTDLLVSYLNSNGYHNGSVIDLTQIFGAIDGYFSLQKRFQDKVGYNKSTYVKLKLMNVWRRIPIIEASIDDLRWNEYGVPVILTNEVCFRKDGAINSFQKVDLHERSDEENDSFLLSTPVLLSFLSLCGLEIGSNENFASIINKGISTSLEKAKIHNK